jgi:hypothetical protein
VPKQSQVFITPFHTQITSQTTRKPGAGSEIPHRSDLVFKHVLKHKPNPPGGMRSGFLRGTWSVAGNPLW